ncbi:MAG: hypothetical protein JXA37_12970 [Chloroflexia bacterium]|nr:hypothetical protein [Chloroflexia bacterium]
MHHSREIPMDPDIAKAFRQLAGQVGATGRFPEGRLTPGDEGEIAIAVSAFKEKVVVNFGPLAVNWIGFSPGQARSLGRLLVRRANEIEEARTASPRKKRPRRRKRR